jgi:hypothetical protein
VSACTDQLSGLHPTCKDAHGRKLAWTAPLAAKYRIEIDAPAPHTVSVDKGAARVKSIAGKAGTTTLLVDLDPADYTIRVEDPPGTAPDKGYTLRVDWVAKKGEPPGELSSGRSLKAEFWASLIAALVCFAMAPLPLLLKRGVPLRLDPNGLTMRDGRTYPWNELQGIRFVSVRSYGETRESSAELSFRTGNAKILYGRLKNLYQVKPILDALGQGRNPWA